MKRSMKIISGIFMASLLLQPTSVFAFSKTETVYSNLDATGKPTKSVVNNQLTGISKGEVIDDTLLKEILNINGDESFEKNERKLTWKSTGKDIFYQGTIEKDNPITISVKYFLDDKEYDVKEIVGKKGKVKIELSFTNNSYILEKKLYTPFVTTTGVIVDGKNNSNIKVSNGKAINTGSKSIIVALASPGLYDNLGLEEFKGLDKITIIYDTTRFSLNNIYTVATPKLLEDKDFEVFDKINNLSSSINTIQENMDKVESGAKKLDEGSKKIAAGSIEISNNLKVALDALLKLENGASEMEAGLKEIITSLNQAQEMLNNKNIDGSIANLEELKRQNNNALANLQNVNSSLSNTYTNYQLNNFKTEDALVIYFKNQGVDDATIKDLVTVKKTYESNIMLVTLLNANNGAIDTMISTLTEVSLQIKNLLTELNKALWQVENGANQLSNGIIQVKSGVEKLYNGSIELVNGVKVLDDGTTTLYNGISTLNKQGINVLTKTTNKVNGYSNQVKELAKLSKEYNGHASNNADKTIFIYKMASVK